MQVLANTMVVTSLQLYMCIKSTRAHVKLTQC